MLTSHQQPFAFAGHLAEGGVIFGGFDLQPRQGVQGDDGAVWIEFQRRVIQASQLRQSHFGGGAAYQAQRVGHGQVDGLAHPANLEHGLGHLQFDGCRGNPLHPNEFAEA